MICYEYFNFLPIETDTYEVYFIDEVHNNFVVCENFLSRFMMRVRVAQTNKKENYRTKPSDELCCSATLFC